MKKQTLILYMALSSLAASAQNKWNAEPYLTKSLSNSAIKDVFVRTSGGSIEVDGISTGEARIEVYISANNDRGRLSKTELEQRLKENYTLEITDDNHELHATAKSKSNMDWGKAVSISFKVYVHKAVSTNLTTSGGSISLSDLAGEQNFTTSGGSLQVSHVSGRIKGRTSGGSIQVDHANQDIDLITSGGSISASNCQGNLNLVTSGGSLQLSQLHGKINATTSGGSINADHISGDLSTSTSGGTINLTQIDGGVEAATSGGSIHAQLNSVGKYVKLNTSSGHIDLSMPQQKGFNLDLKGNRVNTTLANSNFEGSKDEDRIEGKINGGGALVQAYASRGSVNVKFN
ncbi:DUF4097 family beta strand repeat-containing protein [Mucilaginibacter sp. CSA2-8R]|uniref:DUF4097 family beta strand repeat-containing protein n=1 Tax=Mucilaginibacter sp. CSA2-8R TaxID=3141542 RepID=UPI00315DC696